MRVGHDDIVNRRWFTTRIGPESNPVEIHVHPCFGPRHRLDGTGCWCHPTRDEAEQKLVVHNVSN